MFVATIVNISEISTGFSNTSFNYAKYQGMITEIQRKDSACHNAMNIIRSIDDLLDCVILVADVMSCSNENARASVCRRDLAVDRCW